MDSCQNSPNYYPAPWTHRPELKLVKKVPLGSGDFGKVWAAKQEPLDQFYAIKQVLLTKTFEYFDYDEQSVSSEIQFITTLMQEVKCLNELNCDHIVRYYDSWFEGPDTTAILKNPPDFTQIRNRIRKNKDEYSSTRIPPEVNFLFIKMELCDGSLQSWLEETKTLDSRAKEFTPILKQLSLALMSAHKSIVHRDLKPGNILYKIRDGRKLWKIGDFGLSKMWNKENDDEPGNHSMVGTPYYRSPEMGWDIQTGKKKLHSCYNKRTDVYSLGLIYVECAYPFDYAKDPVNLNTLDRFKVFNSLREGDFTILSSIVPNHPQLMEILKGMLHYSAGRRLSAQTVYEMCQKLKDSENVQPGPMSLATQIPIWHFEVAKYQQLQKLPVFDRNPLFIRTAMKIHPLQASLHRNRAHIPLNDTVLWITGIPQLEKLKSYFDHHIHHVLLVGNVSKFSNDRSVELETNGTQKPVNWVEDAFQQTSFAETGTLRYLISICQSNAKLSGNKDDISVNCALFLKLLDFETSHNFFTVFIESISNLCYIFAAYYQFEHFVREGRIFEYLEFLILDKLRKEGESSEISTRNSVLVVSSSILKPVIESEGIKVNVVLDFPGDYKDEEMHNKFRKSASALKEKLLSFNQMLGSVCTNLGLLPTTK